MSNCIGFQTQITSIMEIVTKTAVAEICKLVEEGYAVLRLEISRSQREIELLREKLSIQTVESAVLRESPADGPSGLSPWSSDDLHPGAAAVFEKHWVAPWREEELPDGVRDVEQDKVQSTVADRKSELVIIKEEDLDIRDSKGELEAFEERIAELEMADGRNGESCLTGDTQMGPAIKGKEDTEQHCSTHGVWEDSRLDTALEAVVEKETEEMENPRCHLTKLKESKGEADYRESDCTTFPKSVQIHIYSSNSAATENENPPTCHKSGDYTENIPVTSKPHINSNLPPERSIKKPVVTREKHLNCLYCGKSFGSSRNLEVHNRIHTGEKPFSCTHCGKHFAQLGHLITHQRVHTGEKPFKCTVCGKQFAQSNNLVRHKSVHSGKKPFRCPQCGKSFKTSTHCRRHEIIHCGPTPESVCLSSAVNLYPDVPTRKENS
ncbi:zinc finger protein 484-like [Scleropages formosus]|uniref:zinc finger protein 484-like n=1 Tax=Scleropages formosus TaxID=113540 RepID=UPI000F2F2DA6|nr:zinc finger protein 484-like [Scleropages formosus]